MQGDSNAMRCDAMQYDAMSCSILQYVEIRCYARCAMRNAMDVMVMMMAATMLQCDGHHAMAKDSSAHRILHSHELLVLNLQAVSAFPYTSISSILPTLKKDIIMLGRRR